MKRRLNILIIGVALTGLTLNLLGTALITQAAPTEKSQNMDKPLSAEDIKIVKKTLHPEIGEIKGKPPTPPGKDKDKNGGSEEPAATGILGGSATGNKYAVVVGICNYPDSTGADICNSDGDSLNMYRALTQLYGYNPDDIRLIRDMDATFAAITNAIFEIIGMATSPNDEVVFFFSGHGADGIAQDNDSEKRDEAIVTHNGVNSLQYIWDGQLKEWFSGVTARVIFVFDSCLAGGMNDVASVGRVVNMATSETQVAYVYSRGEEDFNNDGVLDGEGVFSRYFVHQGMVLGWADKYFENGNHNGQVVIEEAFDYTNGIIPALYNRQNPTISDGFSDDLLLGY